jgi:uncharacterized SAM-binding protein YcdF (DUF218 family)
MLKFVIATWLVPPGLFVALSALGGGWLLRVKKRLGGAFLLSLAALIWALSVSPVTNLLLEDLEAPYLPLSKPRGDAIVLLGGGVYGHAPDLTGVGSPTSEMTARIVTAVRLQKRLGVPIVVTGGTLFPGEPAEAPIIGRFLTDLGVPADRIVLESSSRDTRENALFAGAICRKNGFKNPILVTSAFHMRRAVASFEKAGVKVAPFPSSFLGRPGKAYVWWDWFPGIGQLWVSSVAIREHIGLLAYRYLY